MIHLVKMMLTARLGIPANATVDSQDIDVKYLPVLCVAVAIVTTMEIVIMKLVLVTVRADTSLHTANVICIVQTMALATRGIVLVLMATMDSTVRQG